MTGAEAAEKEADKVERAAKRPTLARDEENDDQVIAGPSTPLGRLAGESGMYQEAQLDSLSDGKHNSGVAL